MPCSARAGNAGQCGGGDDCGGRGGGAVSTDEFNAGKGKKTILPFEERLEVVKSIRYVDAVIPETSWEQKTDDVRRLEIAVFTMGDDWVGKFDFLKPHCEVVYLPRTPDISSTGLKAELDRLRAVRGGGRWIRKA